MSRVAIRAEALGKRYRIGERHYYKSMREVLGNALYAPSKLASSVRNGWSRNAADHVWALKDVSFDIREGEVLGLIGRNGAGKSTLLKILSRITKPTEGSAEIRGRVGSLLEVGTGFHPELTGRENVYLNGSILGMKKNEIDRKFDEIVAFSEVERFLETPLKHYSSGMQVRLAFAVAAHLEPEILLVDEVLAVGDLEFQRKCLGKMQEVSSSGRTIVFVSHNINAINALCSRVVLLSKGGVEADGPTTDVTTQYYAEVLRVPSNLSGLEHRVRTGSGKARFCSITIEPRNAEGEVLSAPYPGCDLLIKLKIESQSDIPSCNVAVIIYDSTGYRLVDVNTAQKGSFVSLKAGQKAQAEFYLRELLLKPGTYFVNLWLGRDTLEEIDNIENATSLQFVTGAETAKHVVVFPGPYLCRFENKVSID